MIPKIGLNFSIRMGQAMKSSVARTADTYGLLEYIVRSQKHSAQRISEESTNELQKRADILT